MCQPCMCLQVAGDAGKPGARCLGLDLPSQILSAVMYATFCLQRADGGTAGILKTGADALLAGDILGEANMMNAANFWGDAFGDTGICNGVIFSVKLLHVQFYSACNHTAVSLYYRDILA